MARTGLSGAASLGCYNAGKSGRITLFFGSPTSVAGTYGATLWGAPDLTVSRSATASRRSCAATPSAARTRATG